MSNKNNLSQAEELGNEIYKAVINVSKEHDIVITNRALSYDFIKIFKMTAMDYSGDCILAERIFLKESCTKSEIEIEKKVKEADTVKKKCVNLAIKLGDDNISPEERIKILEKIDKLQKEYDDFATEKAKIPLLTVNPFLDKDPIVVLEINDKSKTIYKSFCNQMAFFCFNYFSAMKMLTYNFMSFEVITVKNVDSIDILCRLKEEV